MNRYHMTAYYEDRTDCARVAQEMIVLAEEPRAAANAARVALRSLASGGQIVAIQFGETGPIAPGVVHVGDPYIPLHWPLTNRLPPPPGAPRTARQLDTMPDPRERGGTLEAVMNRRMAPP